MQERERIRRLFERYQQGRCTPEEEAHLHAWFNRYASGEASGLDDLQLTYEADRGRRKRQWLRLFPYAAAIAAIVFAFGWYINDDAAVNHESEIGNLTPNDVAPGRNRATLTLADGRAIDLSEAQSGIMIGDSIRYLDGSSVIDEQMKRQASGRAPTRLLMLSTPKGGTYQVTLSDGTQVWLNAASTLRYPEQFTGDERTVEIEGEAYFSVTKDARRPFRVNSRDQRVLVLGTEFNISAYVDDAEVKTTLVEGVVQLRAESTGEHTDLFAGQQGLTRKGNIRKRSVDPTSSVAWKNGDFYFDNTPLVEMMKQIERWYDVEVIYENTVPPERFSGGMSRGVTLQTVLQLLKVSEIKYSISDKKLIIE